MKSVRPVEVLLVEDDPGDVELTREAMADSKIMANLHLAENGVRALEFLRRRGEFASAPRPDLILLDLNMPKMDGRTLLAELKTDKDLKLISVVVLTTSKAEEDIIKSYGLGANCYVTKPVGLAEFTTVVTSIEDFWFTVVKLPPR